MAVVQPTTSEVIGVFRSADAQGSGLINEGALTRVLVNLKCQQHDLDFPSWIPHLPKEKTASSTLLFPIDGTPHAKHSWGMFS